MRDVYPSDRVNTGNIHVSQEIPEFDNEVFNAELSINLCTPLQLEIGTSSNPEVGVLLMCQFFEQRIS